MIFIIAVVGLTAFGISQADFYHEPMNIIRWDSLAEFYSVAVDADEDPFSDMPDGDRQELCFAVRNSPQFIFTSNSDTDIISGGVASTDYGSPVQTIIVLIDDTPVERTVMLCELQNEGTFYLGKGHNDRTYFLFMTSVTNNPPKLRATVEFALGITSWLKGAWPYPQIISGADLDQFERRSYRFCILSDVKVLNMCASVHLYHMNSVGNGGQYILNLEPGTPETETTEPDTAETNYCNTQYIECPTEFYVGEIPIKIVTCTVNSYADDNSGITYRITPDPIDEDTFYLVEPHKKREGFVYITTKFTF